MVWEGGPGMAMTREVAEELLDIMRQDRSEPASIDPVKVAHAYVLLLGEFGRIEGQGPVATLCASLIFGGSSIYPGLRRLFRLSQGVATGACVARS